MAFISTCVFPDARDCLKISFELLDIMASTKSFFVVSNWMSAFSESPSYVLISFFISE